MKPTNILLSISLGASLMAPAFSASPNSFWREIGPTDNPDILDTKAPAERNIYELDKAPKQLTLSHQPWADTLWRLDSGLVAGRYGDSDFQHRHSWASRNDYVIKNSARQLLLSSGSDRAQAIDILSPAEKYD